MNTKQSNYRIFLFLGGFQPRKVTTQGNRRTKHKRLYSVEQSKVLGNRPVLKPVVDLTYLIIIFQNETIILIILVEELNRCCDKLKNTLGCKLIKKTKDVTWNKARVYMRKLKTFSVKVASLRFCQTCNVRMK